jgi:hypothetical protein
VDPRARRGPADARRAGRVAAAQEEGKERMKSRLVFLGTVELSELSNVKYLIAGRGGQRSLMEVGIMLVGM